MSNVRNIPLRFIRQDARTQARAGMNHDVVEAYAAKMVDGAKFPPVVLFQDQDHYWLGDGFHRVAAAEKAGKKNINAEIREGAFRDAWLHSIGANDNHGARLTNADKRHAVIMLLQDEICGLWPNRRLAVLANVSDQFVSNMRKELLSSDDTIGGKTVPTVGTPTQEKPAPAAAPAPSTPDSSTWSEMEAGAEEQVCGVSESTRTFPYVDEAQLHPAAPPTAPIKAAPLPPGPDDRDSRIVQMEHLVEAKDAEIAELTRKLEEAGAQVQELAEENASMHRILDAEDLLKSFKEEVVRAQALARTTEERFRGMQNQNKALAKSAESWKGKFDRLQKKTKGTPVPEPDPELEDECPYPPVEV